ncbi:unnamed protein product [Chironomus riparius]|uniref:NADH dehydrogenase [ubiquinone] iron-sulfur protein 6, mitochondrial n=1 Tax=Chironomus riparius TaxID=315576 RepID=A0A9N9RJ33_9DIPT|nr:unnamed protein product [Chironomus riparius]
MNSIRKFASLPQLRNLRHAKSISTQICGALRSAEEGGKVTHTGQAYEADDYRNVRFVNASKIVNPNWAEKLIAEEPIIETEDRVVWCDGGDPRLGHPKVYINLDKPGAHACGYCGLRYQKKEHHH